LYQKSVTLLILFGLLLTACSNPLGRLYPAPGEENQPRPSPFVPTPDQAYPAPWEPVAGDSNLSRGEVSITEKEIQVDTGDPSQYSLFLSGTLPTPCHQLRVTVSKPDEKNQIYVETYSVVDPSEICIQMLESFEVNIPLGSFSSGSQITYTVFVNGQSIGQFVP
jgi:hypothetical protein